MNLAVRLKDKWHATDKRNLGCSGVAEIRVEVPKGKSALEVARYEADTAPFGRVVIVYDSGRTRVYDRFSS